MSASTPNPSPIAKTEKYEREWYRVQFEGFSHTTNLLSREVMEAKKQASAAHSRIDDTVSLDREKDAIIGELSLRLANAEDRISMIEGKYIRLVDRLKRRFSAKQAESSDGPTDRDIQESKEAQCAASAADTGGGKVE